MDVFESELNLLAQEHRLRALPEECPAGAMNLTSNDYLGLAEMHSSFMPEFRERFGDASFTSAASRLLSSNQRYHRMLEDYLSNAYGKDALLLNSGYHANVGCVSALASAGVTLLADKLSHASIIDGIRLGNARFSRWRHNDTAHLRRLLEKETTDSNRCVVILESIYSMDGDIAPIKEIVEIKKEFPGTLIYLDEAHAIGVAGEAGLGIAEKEGLTDQIDILVGTFGKAVASSGAFVATTPLMKSFFINTARSFIFSTAIPPVNAAWTLFMLEKINGMKERRLHLERISRIFRDGIDRLTGTATESRSQIVPLVTGSARKALDIAAYLRKEGIYALPIRRPTVPPGGERIRFSLNASLSDNDISRILSALAGIHD